MWEIHTLGKLPYERLDNQAIVDQVSKGYRLYRPQLANERVHINVKFGIKQENKQFSPV